MVLGEMFNQWASVEDLAGPKGRKTCPTGKVCEVIYDCFGDLEGFVLCDCRGLHTFKTRNVGLARLSFELVGIGCSYPYMLEVGTKTESVSS